MSDPIGAVIAILQGHAEVVSSAGGRIFGGELPAEEAGQMPRRALVVTASGGVSSTGDTFVEKDTQRFDLFAYGATQNEAVALANGAALVLRRTRRGVWANTLVDWIKPAGGATDGRDPALTWPRAFRSFQIMHSLQPITQEVTQ